MDTHPSSPTASVSKPPSSIAPSLPASSAAPSLPPDRDLGSSRKIEKNRKNQRRTRERGENVLEAINSASKITQNLTTELIDGQRKLLALLAAGNMNLLNPIGMQQNNGPPAGLPEMVEAPLDPTKELTRLISEWKYEEAFSMAL